MTPRSRLRTPGRAWPPSRRVFRPTHPQWGGLERSPRHESNLQAVCKTSLREPLRTPKPHRCKAPVLLTGLRDTRRLSCPESVVCSVRLEAALTRWRSLVRNQQRPPRKHAPHPLLGTRPVRSTNGNRSGYVACSHVVSAGNGPARAAARTSVADRGKYGRGPPVGKAPGWSDRGDIVCGRALRCVNRRERNLLPEPQGRVSPELEVSTNTRAIHQETETAVRADDIYPATRTLMIHVGDRRLTTGSAAIVRGSAL